MGNSRRAGAFILAALLAGCALFTIDQRSGEGPRAEDIWKARFELNTGRSPSFDERQRFREEMDVHVGAYLRNRPDLANSYGVGALRLFGQTSVGMTKEEITLLLGKPWR